MTMPAKVNKLSFEFIYEKKVIRRPPATDAQIAIVEARFGRLPADYKLFLQTVNGGVPAPKHAPASDPDDPDIDPRRCFVAHPDPVYSFDVDCFYGLGGEEYYEVEYHSKFLSRRLGREVVAIAGNGCGDALILQAPGDPTVYQWVPDQAVS